MKTTSSTSIGPVYLAHGEGDTRERDTTGGTCTHTIPISSVFHQAAWEGNFGCVQKENDRLKHCWGHMQQIEGVNQNSEQHLSTAYVLVKGGILYVLTDH